MNAVDKKSVGARFGGSRSTYARAAVVQERMGEKLVRELKATGRRFANIFEAGCGCGIFTEKLLDNFAPSAMALNDLWAGFGAEARRLAGLYPGTRLGFFPGDIEGISLGNGIYDLLAANAVFQWVENLHGLFGKIHTALAERGLLAFTSFGPENLREVRRASGRGLDYLGREAVLDAARERYGIVFSEEESVTLHFDDCRAVLAHLRDTGVNSLGTGTWTRGDMERFAEAYDALRSPDGRYPLTYHPCYFILEKK